MGINDELVLELDGIWPNPPANSGMSSSSSTQSLSSPKLRLCLPVNTSRMLAGPSGPGDIESTSTGRCVERDCQPGGSWPHDFFQLVRPTVPEGLIKGVIRF